MDSEYMEQLLERYWQCETSLEEETQLRTFFTQDNVPAHLLCYKKLFIYQEWQQKAMLSDDFDERVLARIEAPVVKAQRISLFARFIPLVKAAAAVAVVLSLGQLMRHSFFADIPETMAVDTIGKQISAPSVALSSEASILCEQQHIDSLGQKEREEGHNE